MSGRCKQIEWKFSASHYYILSIAEPEILQGKCCCHCFFNPIYPSLAPCARRQKITHYTGRWAWAHLLRAFPSYSTMEDLAYCVLISNPKESIHHNENPNLPWIFLFALFEDPLEQLRGFYHSFVA